MIILVLQAPVIGDALALVALWPTLSAGPCGLMVSSLGWAHDHSARHGQTTS